MSTFCKRTELAAGIVALVLGVIGRPAFSHHSFTAQYDQKKPIQLTGKLTKMIWSNPHAWIYLDVRQADGKTANWALETGSATSLIRRKWRKEDLKFGTILSVDGWQALDGSRTVNVRSIAFTDGRRLFAGSSNAAVAEK